MGLRNSRAKTKTVDESGWVNFYLFFFLFGVFRVIIEKGKPQLKQLGRRAGPDLQRYYSPFRLLNHNGIILGEYLSVKI